MSSLYETLGEKSLSFYLPGVINFVSIDTEVRMFATFNFINLL